MTSKRIVFGFVLASISCLVAIVAFSGTERILHGDILQLDNGANYTTVTSSASAPNTTFTYPPDNGTANYVLRSDGAGSATWVDPLSTFTKGNLTDGGTDGITVTGGTGAVIGSGTSLSQHVADMTHNGYLSSTDWTTFNGKQATIGVTAPITLSGSTVGITQAGSSSSGYLSSADWNIFNSVASGGVTSLTGDVTGTGPGATATTVAKIQGTAVSGVTGTGNVAFSASPTFTGTVQTGDVRPTTSYLSNLGSASKIWNSIYTSIFTLDDGSGHQLSNVMSVGGTGNYGLVWPNAQGGSSTILQNDGSGNLSWASRPTGTVSSVALSVPSLSLFGVTGSPVTTSGTLGLTTTGTSGGVPYFSSSSALSSSSVLTQNGVMIGGGSGLPPVTVTNNGTATNEFLTQSSSGTPAWAALVAGDIPNISAAKITSGTLAVAEGGTGVGSVTTAPTATAFAGWDANSNLSANSFLEGYATTVTSGGATTTLTVASAYQQYFTGSASQFVKLPAVSTMVLGQGFQIINSSSATLTVESSGTNSILAMSPNTWSTWTVIATVGTGASAWNYEYGYQSGGSVTSVGFSSPGGIFGVSGSPVSTSGTLTETVSGTSGGIPYFSASNALSSSGALTANAVVIGGGAGTTPAVVTNNSTGTNEFLTQSSSGAPAWATIAAGDVPNLAASKITSGALAATVGGTAQSTYTTGDTLYASGTNTLSKLAVGSNGDLYELASGVPSWSSTITTAKTYSNASLTLTETTATNQLTITQSGASSGAAQSPLLVQLTNTSGALSPAGEFESASDSGFGALRALSKSSGRTGTALDVEGYGTAGSLITAFKSADTTPVLAFSVSSAGGVTIGSNTTSDTNLGTVDAVVNTAYYEGHFTANFTGARTTSSVFHYVRSGKMVTLSWASNISSGCAASPGNVFTTGASGIPSSIVPARRQEFVAVGIQNNGSAIATPGDFLVDSDGTIDIFRSIDGTAFTGTTNCGFFGGAVTYTMN